MNACMCHFQIISTSFVTNATYSELLTSPLKKLQFDITVNMEGMPVFRGNLISATCGMFIFTNIMFLGQSAKIHYKCISYSVKELPSLLTF